MTKDEIIIDSKEVELGGGRYLAVLKAYPHWSPNASKNHIVRAVIKSIGKRVTEFDNIVQKKIKDTKEVKGE